jgi:hypothetical protein
LEAGNNTPLTFVVRFNYVELWNSESFSIQNHIFRKFPFSSQKESFPGIQTILKYTHFHSATEKEAITTPPHFV